MTHENIFKHTGILKGGIKLIIVGYPGIGKSTLAGKESGCIDLESSDFKKMFPSPVYPVKEWVRSYCITAENLAKQGFTVFVSSHEAVREYFRQIETENIGYIYPSLKIRDKWVGKLLARFNSTGLEKDERAYERAEVCYTMDIKRLKAEAKGHPYSEISDLDYDLLKIVDMMERKNRFEKEHHGCTDDACPIVFD